MGHYILRRLLIAVPSLLGISIVLFTVLALAPGVQRPEQNPMITGAGFQFWNGGITKLLDREGISEKVTGKKFHA